MQLRYSFRVYPTVGQRQALARAFGCVRVVYNDALRAREAAREAGLPFVKAAELSAALTKAKKTPERAWLGEVSSVILQQALRDVETAYRAFFDGLAGERPRMGGSTVQIPQRPAPVDPVHRQRPLAHHRGRRTRAPQDRRSEGEVVPHAAVGPVHGDGDQGRRRAVHLLVRGRDHRRAAPRVR
ncbi:transposase [Spirillospora sp. NPDC052242]